MYIGFHAVRMRRSPPPNLIQPPPLDFRLNLFLNAIISELQAFLCSRSHKNQATPSIDIDTDTCKWRY